MESACFRSSEEIQLSLAWLSPALGSTFDVCSRFYKEDLKQICQLDKCCNTQRLKSVKAAQFLKLIAHYLTRSIQFYLSISVGIAPKTRYISFDKIKHTKKLHHGQKLEYYTNCMLIRAKTIINFYIN